MPDPCPVCAGHTLDTTPLRLPENRQTSNGWGQVDALADAYDALVAGHGGCVEAAKAQGRISGVLEIHGFRDPADPPTQTAIIPCHEMRD